MEEETDKTPEELALEKEFEELNEKISPQISDFLRQAEAALDKAVSLADKHGIPFSTGISFLSNTYTPQSFVSSKFKKLDRDAIDALTGVWECEYAGWQHSAVC